jgi:phosphonate transport system substrate-binding protein
VLRRTALVATASGLLQHTPTAQASPRLRVGLTAVILADQAAFLARWSDYFAQRAGLQVSFAVRDEYQAILEQIGSGQLDAAWICGYPYVRHQKNLRLLAVPLYKGTPSYESYLIRRPGDRRIQGWQDLTDKVFAYSDPLSNSGWLVAQGEMAGAGVAPQSLRRAFFAHGHRHVAEAVAAGLADAGSIDGYVWETMKLQKMAAARQSEVIWRSRPHAFPPIVVPAGRVSQPLQALSKTLQAMPNDALGQALLKALNLDGFVQGQDSWYDSIRQLARRVPSSGVST